jgi:hypothetical protein
MQHTMPSFLEEQSKKGYEFRQRLAGKRVP